MPRVCRPIYRLLSNHGQVQDHVGSCLCGTAFGAARAHLPEASASRLGARRDACPAMAEGQLPQNKSLGREGESRNLFRVTRRFVQNRTRPLSGAILA